MTNPWEHQTFLTDALDKAEAAASSASTAQRDGPHRTDEGNGKDVAVALTHLETAVLWLRQAVAKETAWNGQGLNE